MAFRRKETRDVGAVFDVFKDPEQNAVHEQTDRQTDRRQQTDRRRHIASSRSLKTDRTRSVKVGGMPMSCSREKYHNQRQKLKNNTSMNSP